MVDQAEIISSLTPLNGTYFSIPNLDDYAQKVTSLGKSIEIRHEHTGQLVSYILYYDNGPDLFITMVWTHPEHRGQGYAKRLLTQLIHSSSKDVKLEVHEQNPAMQLYRDLGFVLAGKSGTAYSMCLQKRIAVMQPYVFPYLGYFHLIDASSLFVFYDDVHYIKGGWINRNRILMNGSDCLFTVPLSNASPNSLINETRLAVDDRWREKFRRTLTQAYQKAPYFSQVMPLVTSVFAESHCSVSDLAIRSMVQVCDYLGITFNYTRSSDCSPESKGMDKADRLIEIVKAHGYKRYVNAAGGDKLYAKEYFESKGVELGFIESLPVEYRQHSNKFVPWLSIIDVMMFNDVGAIREFQKRYRIT